MNKYQEALIKLVAHNYSTRSEKNEYINILQELIDEKTPMKPPLKWEYAKPQTRCKCSAGVEKYHKYCWHCGQKLDWSDEDA